MNLYYTQRQVGMTMKKVFSLEDVREALASITARSLNVDKGAVYRDMTSGSKKRFIDYGADDLDTVEIVTLAEKKFGVSVPEELEPGRCGSRTSDAHIEIGRMADMIFDFTSKRRI